MEKQEQKELIARVMEYQDGQAFEKLVRSVQRECVGIIYQYTIPLDDQKDIFQEVCIRLWRYLIEKKFQERNGGLHGLALQITRNLCINYLRLKKKHNKVPINILEFERKNISIQIPQYNEIFSEEDQENFKRFFKSVPREQKVVYLLRMSRGKSFQEIAKYLKISVNTVLGRMRYFRVNFEKNRKKFNL